jgi:SAM-dependent methyltransferase
MVSRRAPAPGNISWSERGSAAVDAGDLEAAKGFFLKAAKADMRNARHRFHLAVVLEGLDEADAAAAALTEALRLDPTMADAARRLASLLSHYALSSDAGLNAIGLRAALQHDTVDREAIAEVAIRHLASREPLQRALASGRSKGWLGAARSLCLRNTAQVLKDELLLAVLRTSVFRHPDTERLLTALRRVLLIETPHARFGDRALVAFVIALMRQCWVNEHVWAVSAEEASIISECKIATLRLIDGDPEEGRKLLLVSLYRPLSEALGALSPANDVGKANPPELREVVACRLAEQAQEWERAESIPSLGAATDETSSKVAQQYETNPYPRWTSLALPRAGGMRRILARFVASEQLSFMDGRYEVLIAGCGTGQAAIGAALAYGPNARVLGLDLSAASLGYASRMAEHFSARNLEFVRGDILQLEAAPQFLSRFGIIECTGVLHHMADPFAGWRVLAKCLAPGGLMLVGLYSHTSRRNLVALRSDPAYPGAGCDAAALRVFRQDLLERPDLSPGGELKVSRDFYTTSNFRDLVLHVSERPVTLPEIEQFLRESELAFKGFQFDPETFGRFQERFPEEVWPGRLERWAEFEQEHPRAFDGMYVLWCAAA